MKKIGIVTFCKTKNNYGTILQNYALQTFLKNKNFETYLIKTGRTEKKITVSSKLKNLRKFTFKDIFIKLFSIFSMKFINFVTNMNKKNEKRNFDSFINTYLSPIDIFNTNTKLEFDYCISGSDQVWNTFSRTPEQMNDELDMYLLSFTNSKKIACAASFGVGNLDSRFNTKFKENLSKFDFISVREQSGVEICKKIGIENVVLQNDPTMLLTVDDYRKIARTKEKESEYILVYILGNKTKFSWKEVQLFAKKNGLKIVLVTANENSRFSFNKQEFPTINEWLGLYNNAKYVVTNSFHGTVFSLIFNKPFSTYLQMGKFQGQNMRILSLLETFNLSNRIIDSKLIDLDYNIDWNMVNEKLNSIRVESPFVKYIGKLCNE